MSAPCTIEHHEALKLDDATFKAAVINLRPWPAAGAELAECARCHSTLMRVVGTPTDPALREEEVRLAG